MWFFNKFFNKSSTVTRYEMITDQGGGFYAWSGKLYQSDIIRACIRPTAKAIGKLTVKHIRKTKNKLEVNPEVYIKFLLTDPNPYMSNQVMLEKVVTQLELNNNAFIYIHRDKNGYPLELYPVNCLFVQAIYDKQGMLFLKFTMKNGKIVTYDYRDIIHLRQDFNDGDIFGDSSTKVLTALMKIVNTADQGIIKAIENSSVIKWLVKFNQSLRAEDVKKKTKEFVDDFLSVENGNGGAIGMDSKAEVTQVDPKDYVPNALQMEKTTQRIYSFLNVNEKIVQSKFTEDEWVSYYEAKLEPIILQLSNEYTRKLFTRKERMIKGDEIVFESSNLQYASLRTKLEFVQMVDRGSLLPNEWRNIFNLGPVEGGDEPIRRLDTAVVKEGGEGK